MQSLTWDIIVPDNLSVLPNDLRDYRPSAFSLFTEEEAAALIAVLLVVAFILDFFGVLSK